MNNKIPSQKTLKSLMIDYTFNTANTEYDDSMVNIINKLDTLSQPDKIILLLYAELQSFRKLADVLNVSFTTAYHCIQNIRKKLLDNDLS